MGSVYDGFRWRPVLALPAVSRDGWHLKRYAILSDGWTYDPAIPEAATQAAFDRLPPAGPLDSSDDNNGVAFQIVHFAQVAIVSPVFYWQWGMVLANLDQMRAPLDAPTAFDVGVVEVVGCVWEMQIVTFETEAWTKAMLGAGAPRLDDYLAARLPSAEMPGQ